MVSDNENIDISEWVAFYGDGLNVALYLSALEKLIVVIAYSNLVSVETVSRLFKRETLVDFPRLKLRRSFVVLIEKQFIAPVDSFNHILYCLGIQIFPM